MGTWQHWLESWIALIQLPPQDTLPEDQFVVSTDQGSLYVLENSVDHVMLSLRFPASGYRAKALASTLLALADPQKTKPFALRLGFDGVAYFVLGVSLSLHQHTIQDLEAAFSQLWSVNEILYAQL